MALTPLVKELLDLSKELEPKIGFAFSTPDPLEEADGGRLATRIELVTRWQDELPKFQAAMESFPAACSEIIALRTAIANTLHSGADYLSEIFPARTALEAAAYQAAGVLADKTTNTVAQQSQREKIFPMGQRGIGQDTIDVAVKIHDEHETKERGQIAREHFSEFDDCVVRAKSVLKDIRARESKGRINLPDKRNSATKRNGHSQ